MFGYDGADFGDPFFVIFPHADDLQAVSQVTECVGKMVFETKSGSIAGNRFTDVAIVLEKAEEK